MWPFRRRSDDDFRREIDAHLAVEADRLIDEGVPPGEARAAARRLFGNATGVLGRFYESRRVMWLDDLRRDLWHALRTLRRSPAFTAVALVTLVLGIGATTALFSLVNAVLLRPLPVRDPERLVVLWEDVTAAGFPRNTPAPANYVDWRAQNRTFEDIAAAMWQTFTLTGSGEPERLNGLRVTANFLTLLGVRPAIGRLMLPAEDGPEASRVAVISYGFWQRYFGSDPNLVGRSINLNNEPHTVVGVAPQGFQFPATGADVWVAPAFTPRDLAQRGAHFLFVIGRLKAGVALSEARADMTTIARRLETQYPETNKDVGVLVLPLRDHYVGDFRLALNLLLAAVGALLLIACANLAHLFLAREATRHREIAMRAALGASRPRIMRQLLSEYTVFAAVAAVLGAALSVGAFGFLARLIPESFPEGTALHFDWRVFFFTACMAILSSTFFGAAPAVQTWRFDLNAVLKRAGDRTIAGAALGTLRGTIVMAEVALTVVLLVAAGLLLTSYVNIRSVNTGFRAENVLTLETSLPPTKYRDSVRRAEFYRQVIERTTRHPSVISAGYVNFPPLTLKGGTNGFVIEGRPRPRPGEGPDANNRAATHDYLRTIGVPLLRGRYHDERDGPNTPRVVVINQIMARAYWPGESALGARIRFGDGGPDQPAYTVIGVVGDVKQMGLDAPPRPEMYFPVTQAPGGSFFWPRTLVVRTAGDPYDVVADIRRGIAEVDPDQPVANIRTMNEILDNEVAGRETQTAIVMAFAMFALLLASVGLYGVLHYSVAQRTVEIGVRVALGAQRADVIRGIMIEALRWTTIGVACGLAGAFVVTRFFSALLFDVSPTDPRAYAGVTLLLVVVAIIASFIPARRAATVDPMVALRHE